MRQYVALIALLGSLSGCAGLIDPYKREGTWAPTGINDDNLRLMVVNPADLQRGTGAADSTGQTAAVAVNRERTDTVKTLPDFSIGPITSSGSGGAGGGPGTGGAAATSGP
jgi:hypothetical protein